jgi:hypothetical protein
MNPLRLLVGQMGLENLHLDQVAVACFAEVVEEDLVVVVAPAESYHFLGPAGIDLVD